MKLFNAIVCLGLVFGSVNVFSQSDEFGKWKKLFDGKTTSGWVNVRGKNAGKSAPRWRVEDGALTNISGGVDDICTVDTFSNYQLEADYKVPEEGNSGIYLRGSVEVQICDSQGKKNNLSPSDVGGIYGGTAPLSNPQKRGGWNHFRICHIGYRITVWQNGVLVQDNVYRAENTAGCHPKYIGTPERGPIMLQGNHSKIYYKNIRIRPICCGKGWRPIWTGKTNGKDIAKAFSSSPNPKAKNRVKDSWEYKDYAVTNKAAGHSGRDMWTKERFGNFLVHYEYKTDPKIGGGNSGFYLRDQWEVQIFKSSSLTEPHSDGSLYSIYSPEKLARSGPENWNLMDVMVKGMKIWVWQNGILIQNGKQCKTRTDNHGVKTLKFSKAPFKLQGDHGKVWFTNIYIKPLPDGEK